MRTPECLRWARVLFLAGPLPLRDGAVGRSQGGQVVHHKGPGAGCLYIHLDAQAGTVGGQQVALGKLHLSWEDVVEETARRSSQLLHAEVAGGQIQMQAGGSGNRSERVVSGQIDGMRLA